MLFPAPLLELPQSVEATMSSVRRQAKYAAKPSICLVCKDTARIQNYGCISCASCKTFFRRHGFRIEKVDPCRFQGNCDVTLRARRICAACRLAKCLAAGMSPDLIRKEDLSDRHWNPSSKLKNQPNSLTQSKKLTAHLYPLDLLNCDRSSLTTTEWTLFSNIVHAYDILSPAVATRNEIARQSSLPMKIRLKLAQDFIPNLVISFYTSLQSYIKCTNEFRTFTEMEQGCVYRRNFHSISSLTGQLILRESGFFENTAYMYAFGSLYDAETLARAGSIIKRLDYDSTLVKIFLLIISFSSNCFLVDRGENLQEDCLLRKTKVLLRYQNLYAELLWKYMMFRYGPLEAAARFSGLIKQILDLIPLAVDAYIENSTHHVMVDEITERTERKLNMTDH